MSTNAGFVIGSLGTPHVVCASDQIKVVWVLAYNVYHNHYIYFCAALSNNLLAKGYSIYPAALPVVDSDGLPKCRATVCRVFNY